MFWFTTILAAVSFSIVVAQSATFIDSSTGITFQRVQTSGDGSSVAIALPPQGAAASDAIIQMTGPLSQGFAGVSPAANLQLDVLLVCCMCCDLARRSIKGSLRQPMFGALDLIGGSSSDSTKAIQPVLTQVADPEITDTTFKVTFRCQNCTFTQSKDSKFTTLSTIASTNNPSSISDPSLKFNPATDTVHNVQFDLTAARFSNYWSVVDRL